jgi:hypothetical protein
MSKRPQPPEPPASPPTPGSRDKGAADPGAAASKGSGRVQFDERGQAVWEWAVRTGMFDRNASTQRVRALTETPVKLELEQTIGAIKRSGAASKGEEKPASSFNPYEAVKSKATPKERGGTDPYSRGGAKRPESVTFNPYERRPKNKP